MSKHIVIDRPGNLSPAEFDAALPGFFDQLLEQNETAAPVRPLNGEWRYMFYADETEPFSIGLIVNTATVTTEQLIEDRSRILDRLKAMHAAALAEDRPSESRQPDIGAKLR